MPDAADPSHPHPLAQLLAEAEAMRRWAAEVQAVSQEAQVHAQAAVERARAMRRQVTARRQAWQNERLRRAPPLLTVIEGGKPE